MSNLAVIPARGGSKRLPRKNVMPLAGVPMIAYSVAAAVDSGLFEMVVVSTDDPEIAQIAKEHGAEVPFLRHSALADDHTPVSAVTVDTLKRLESQGNQFTQVAQLMPNCPFRTAGDVATSLLAFEGQPYCSQVSVTRYGWQNPWWALQQATDGSVEPLFQEQLLKRSQDLPTLYCPTGAVWWARAETLKEHGTFHLSKRALFELPWDRAIDIDDLDDFRLAEALLQRAAGYVP